MNIKASIQPQRLAGDRVAVRMTWREDKVSYERRGEGDYLELAIGQAIGVREVEFDSGVDDLAAAICLHRGRSFTATIQGNRVLEVH